MQVLLEVKGLNAPTEKLGDIKPLKPQSVFKKRIEIYTLASKEEKACFKGAVSRYFSQTSQH